MKSKGLLLQHQPVIILMMLMISPAMAAGDDPPEKTVRVFYICPTDVPLDSAYPEGIAKVMRSSQRYFMEQCKFTFRLNDPVCEVIKGTHVRSWYENNACGSDRYWCAVDNAQQDLLDLVPSVKNDGNRKKWKIVFYIDAEGQGAGGGGGGGWVLLPKHDADGAKGFPKDTARWCGGMCHELGHCFGLPDATRDDGTVMSADFYHWPVNCIFTADQATKMKNLPDNAGFWVDNITGTGEEFNTAMNLTEQWTPVICGNQLKVPFSMANFFPATLALYSLSGKRVVLYKPAMSEANKNLCTFDVSMLKPGNYVCSLEKHGKNERTNIVRKIN